MTENRSPSLLGGLRLLPRAALRGRFIRSRSRGEGADKTPISRLEDGLIAGVVRKLRRPRRLEQMHSVVLAAKCDDATNARLLHGIA
jgi:hypothetical protein